MTNFSDLVDEWHSRVRRDLTPFTDPGTDLQTSVDGRAILARWTMRNQPYVAEFMVSAESGIIVRTRDAELSYPGFFSGPDMADLLGLAKMILQSARQTVFVDTPGSLPESPENEHAPATVLLKRSLDTARGLAATAILIVTGDAGSGKTSVLQELVREAADDFASGRSSHVLLYVNAQGRALARFDEALATELSDLRARLTYHTVPTLTRLGLLVPVIDGFDELLGVSGYDEAFSSLSRFVEELSGEGQIIASARSTYYEQEFVSRANSVSSLGAQIWHQIPVRVLEWGSAEVDSYFDEQLKREGAESLRIELREAFDRAFASDSDLLSKPFFVSRVLSLVMEGQTFNEPGELLDMLVIAYADREVGKLRGRAGEPLLNRSQIVELLQEIAEEMWNEESRELSRRSTQDVAEFVLATHGVPESVQRYVIERIPSFAFLSPGAKEGNVAFEHESFFAFFLGTRLAIRIEAEPIQLHTLLGRSAMPEQVADSAARQSVKATSQEGLRQLLRLISAAAAIESPRNSQVRENGGLLFAALLRIWCATHNELTDGIIENVVVPGSNFSGVTLRRFVFTDVEFRRVDLSRTRILVSTFRRGLLHDVVVDPTSTRLEFAEFDPSLQVFGLRVVSGGSILLEYEPSLVRETLALCGMEHLTASPAILEYSVSSDVVEIVERFVRAYQRSNPISVNEEEARTSAIWRSPHWPRVEQLLTQSSVVRPEYRSSRGTRRTFLRRQVNSEELLVGADPAARVSPPVRSFWQSLATEFPKRK